VNLREYWNYFLVNERDSAESSVEYVWRWYCNATVACTRSHSPRKYKQMRFRNREVANAIASVSNSSDARLSSKLCRSFTKTSIRIVKLIAPTILRGLAFVSTSQLYNSHLSINAIQIIRYEEFEFTSLHSINKSLATFCFDYATLKIFSYWKALITFCLKDCFFFFYI